MSVLHTKHILHTPERNWNTFSSQVDLCCDDELDMATSLEAPTREHISLGRHYLGKMDILCPQCSALHWMDERLARSSRSNPLFGTCCLQGKIKLHALITPPPPLKALFDGDDVRSKSFRMYIRVYNTTNAFTSLGATFDDRVLPGRGPTPFTIHGELRHRVGSLLPQQGNDASYAQLYIYDPASALEARNRRNQQLRRDVGTNPRDVVHLPSTIGKCRDLNELLSSIYPKLDVASTSTPTFLTERTILSARNEDVNAINGAALDIFPGDVYTYLAADKMSEEDEIDSSITNRYPNEYLNSLDPAGLPPFKLDLKVGCPIILLRNIAPKDGLCNGTRMMVVRWGQIGDYLGEAK
ncbi:hypothetical protein Vadar_031941 [Vaccinium darrowii]|uniref:Uncharacterized protein n=1 Tax=Vaccinium darrowii TaxID=229202 RepID=A0ACB7X698_9ERIC|nr:hypothetical protein Vadar_031941 [Vaccinium darrowii]